MELGKKLILLSTVVASLMASEAKYSYEITPVLGVVIPEGNIGVKNEKAFGAQLQFNDVKLFDLLNPQITILQTPSTDYKDYNNLDTKFTRVLVNGVHEYDAMGKATPYALVGAGYEHMSYAIDGNYNDSYVLDAGAGIKYALSEDFALKAEALYMLKNNVNRWDSNLGLLAGVTYSFGQKAQAPAPTPVAAPVVVVDGDDDKDGVLNSKDKCPDTTLGAKVDANGCEIVVKACPVEIDLKLNFEFDSYKLDAPSKVKVAEFAEFLKCNPTYEALIVGHTDNKGSHKYNQKLSQNRAESTRAELIANGISASRVQAVGKSFDQPVATNATAEGRAQNRRIIAILEK